MKSAEKARNNGLYRHIRTSKEIIRNLLNDYSKASISSFDLQYFDFFLSISIMHSVNVPHSTSSAENIL